MFSQLAADRSRRSTRQTREVLSLMTIEQSEVISMLGEALPEFGDAIREHIADWPDDPMLYILIGPLFDYVAAPRAGQERERLQFARRAYEFVDKMLLEGTSSVQNCFAIQMIEPLAGDPKTVEQRYPGIESVLGPAGKKELSNMREWGRRYRAMNAAIGRINEQLGQGVLRAVGVGESNARVIVELSAWSRLSERRQDEIYRRLRSDWKELTGQAKSLTITGPREAGFEILRGC
ncbi:MAG: hypothetical protein WCC84_16750 [Candidatus Cybelea sp.]